MYLFAHIFFGVLLGIGFWRLTDFKRVIPACIVGSVLPDLVDKPLALVCAVLDCGRTVTHALVFTIAIMLVILIFARFPRKESPDIILFGICGLSGVILHQILDQMWIVPQNWFFPLLGPFQRYHGTGSTMHWLLAIWMDAIGSPFEWIYLIMSVGLLWYIRGYNSHTTRIITS